MKPPNFRGRFQQSTGGRTALSAQSGGSGLREYSGCAKSADKAVRAPSRAFRSLTMPARLALTFVMCIAGNATGISAQAIPAGLLRIAQGFNLGSYGENRRSPEGTADKAASKSRKSDSAVPSGLDGSFSSYPTLKGWAIITPSLRDEHDVLVTLGIVSVTPAAQSQTLTDTDLAKIRFDQKLGSQISLDLPFRDEEGNAVTLGRFFGQKPVVLVMGYYECPMLCTLAFNGMVTAMQDLKWSIGKEFTVLHVSINPAETASLAAAKKQTYLKRYGRTGAADGWHFLTGDEVAIRQLAQQVGFHYAYDASVKQYAHPSGLIVLTPEGKVVKYVFGVTFEPREINNALQDASARKVGSPLERLALLCFHYSPFHGRYSAIIMAVVRVLAAATITVIAWILVAQVWRERHKRPSGTVPRPETFAQRR
jgi:protein SCO1/2